MACPWNLEMLEMRSDGTEILSDRDPHAELAAHRQHGQGERACRMDAQRAIVLLAAAVVAKTRAECRRRTICRQVGARGLLGEPGGAGTLAQKGAVEDVLAPGDQRLGQPDLLHEEAVPSGIMAPARLHQDCGAEYLFFFNDERSDAIAAACGKQVGHSATPIVSHHA